MIINIHGVEIEDPLSSAHEYVNDFNASPPFGLFDIFNHLIYSSTEYDKQGLAAYKAFDDYCLFEEGYVESLLTKPSPSVGVHLYLGKVRPSMKIFFLLTYFGANIFLSIGAFRLLFSRSTCIS